MSNVTITNLTALTGVATDDELPIWDASAAQTKKATVTNVLATRLTGTGVVVTSTFTLTIPATMTAAGRDVANTFSVGQTISPTSTSAAGLIVNAPSGYSANNLLSLQYNGTEKIRALPSTGAASSFINLIDADNGAGVEGQQILLGRNSNASPAAGFVRISNNAGSGYRIWPDASGNLRIWNGGNPTNANDTSGTVVGTQTSHADFKRVLGEPVSAPTALANLREAAKQVQRFVYRSGAYNGQEFSGLVIDGAQLHRYGMDADTEHPAGKTLNEINVIGDLLLAVDFLAQRLEALEAKGAKI